VTGRRTDDITFSAGHDQCKKQAYSAPQTGSQRGLLMVREEKGGVWREVMRKEKRKTRHLS